VTTSSSDRRRHPRQPVRLQALAVANDGLSRLETTIVDMSISGAKLEMDDAEQLPTSFYMLLPQHRLQPCRLVWRSGRYAGVAYAA
jgi:hypothetical protein